MNVNNLSIDLRLMSEKYHAPLSDLLDRAADKIEVLNIANERLSKELELLNVPLVEPPENKNAD